MSEKIRIKVKTADTPTMDGTAVVTPGATRRDGLGITLRRDYDRDLFGTMYGDDPVFTMTRDNALALADAIRAHYGVKG